MTFNALVAWLYNFGVAKIIILENLSNEIKYHVLFHLN